MHHSLHESGYRRDPPSPATGKARDLVRERPVLTRAYPAAQIPVDDLPVEYRVPGRVAIVLLF
jgi:hypothetical protein